MGFWLILLTILKIIGIIIASVLVLLLLIASLVLFVPIRYGAQGGTAADIAYGFDENGLGGIVNASRSLMCAYKSDKWKDKFEEKDYAQATRAEAIRMRDELNSVLK